MKCSVDSQGPSVRGQQSVSTARGKGQRSLTGRLPHGDAEVALRRLREEAVGGSALTGWGPPEEAADPGGDDAGVHAEERGVERDDAEDAVATLAGAVEEEHGLGGQDAAHRVAEQHDVRGPALERR